MCKPTTQGSWQGRYTGSIYSGWGFDSWSVTTYEVPILCSSYNPNLLEVSVPGGRSILPYLTFCEIGFIQRVVDRDEGNTTYKISRQKNQKQNIYSQNKMDGRGILYSRYSCLTPCTFRIIYKQLLITLYQTFRSVRLVGELGRWFCTMGEGHHLNPD